MSNVYFCPANLALYTMSMSPAEDPNYPLVNLTDYDPYTLWKSSDNTTMNQWLQIDMGSAVSCNYIIVDQQDANAIPSGYVLYASSTSDFSADVTTITTLDVSKTYEFKSFSAFARRYWRLVLSEPTGTDYWTIGNLFIGTCVSSLPYQYGYRTEALEHAVVQKIALDGRIRTSRNYTGGRKIFEVTFPIQDNTFRSAWLTFCSTIKNSQFPFYFTDFDSTPYYVMFDRPYNPLTTVAYGWNAVESVKMITQLSIY
jgi:hypothetical protein